MTHDLIGNFTWFYSCLLKKMTERAVIVSRERSFDLARDGEGGVVDGEGGQLYLNLI